MRTSSAVVFAAAALFSQVSATLYVTAPVAGTDCPAGVVCNLAWDDDGTTPALGTIGVCSIDLCTGGPTQQTCLQNISPAQDVSQIASLPFTPNADIGPSGDFYFIKFISASQKDLANPAQPFTAFSHTFTLSAMTGTFNATVQAQVDSATASAGAPSVSVAAPTGSAAPALTTSVKPSGSSTATTGTTKATTTAKASGALNVVSSLMGVSIAAGLVGLISLGF